MGLNILSWPFLTAMTILISGLVALYIGLDPKTSKAATVWYVISGLMSILVAVLIAKFVY